MLQQLTDNEKELMHLLVMGRASRVIMEMLVLDLVAFQKIKRSLFKKLNIKRTAQLLYVFIENTNSFEML